MKTHNVYTTNFSLISNKKFLSRFQTAPSAH